MNLKNDKGISLSITAIVVIAVGLVVMLVVLGYFVGGFGSTGESMKKVTDSAGASTGADEIGAGVGGISNIWKGDTGDKCDENSDCKSGTCNLLANPVPVCT